MRGRYNNGSTEATTSCASTSPHGGYNEATTSLSLSHALSVHSYTHYTHTTTNCSTTNFTFALSHIYIHMTFGLFTLMAPRGPQEHIYTCVSFQSVGRITTGLSGSPKLPIRRDLFPNKLPLHSGMGCRVSPIRFRHASNLSGVSTLVSMSDPFSTVWIFVNANSRSSTRSRIQWYLCWICFVLEWYAAFLARWMAL